MQGFFMLYFLSKKYLSKSALQSFAYSVFFFTFEHHFNLCCMKKFLLPAIIFSASVKISFGQNIAINSTGAAAAASAMLEVGTGAPDTKGLLIPRASLSTTTDLMGNASLATGLLVYNSNASMTGGWIGFWYWGGE